MQVFVKKVYFIWALCSSLRKKRKKEAQGCQKSLVYILDIADIVLVSSRPAPENNLFLVLFNHIASHLGFNPQHTHGGLGAPQNRSKFKMISKCLAANLIHINLRQSMCQNPNIYKMQICTSGESSLQQVIIELNLV